MKHFARLAASTVTVAAGLGLAGLGAAAGAQAQPAPFPGYHWCPGQDWDDRWGPNWDATTCHGDFHRDIDGFNHSRDYRGAGPGEPGWGYGPGGDYGPEGDR